MIPQFPVPYPDESAFSLACRYHVRSGNISLKDTMEDLFGISGCHLTTDLSPAVSEGVLDALHMDLVSFMNRFTLITYYGLFLPENERETLLEDAARGDRNLRHHIPKIRKRSREEHWYCPLCARKDREIYGETYWHLFHQIEIITACPEHECRLSFIKIAEEGKRAAVSIFPAETGIPKELEKPEMASSLEVSLSKYVSGIVSYQGGFSQIPVHDYLSFRLIETPYLSRSGGHRYLKEMEKDIQDYFNSLPALLPFIEQRQLFLCFNRERAVSDTICMAAFFLGVPAERLMDRIDFTEAPQLGFAKEAEKLHKEGVPITGIAKIYGVSPRAIYRALTLSKQKQDKNLSYTKSHKKRLLIDREKLDFETLPKVKTVIDSMIPADGSPYRITIAAVARSVRMNPSKFITLPGCVGLLRKHTCSYEEYWARKLEWEYRNLAKEGKVNWQKLREQSGVQKRNLGKAFPYIEDEGLKSFLQERFGRF